MTDLSHISESSADIILAGADSGGSDVQITVFLLEMSKCSQERACPSFKTVKKKICGPDVRQRRD
jgi:hypothetical protein